VGGIRTSEGGGAIKGQNNTYVGKDGNVYRKNDSGWSKYENGAWAPVDRPQASRPSQLPAQPGSGDRAGQGQIITGDLTRDLNRESANRTTGNQRATQWNQQYDQRTSARPAQRSAPAAMPRGGGGMPRGGGGRR
jgi:hypothetical protein